MEQNFANSTLDEDAEFPPIENGVSSTKAASLLVMGISIQHALQKEMPMVDVPACMIWSYPLVNPLDLQSPASATLGFQN